MSGTHQDVERLARDPEVAPLLRPYLRFQQRIERTQEIADMERVLSDPLERKHLHNPGRLKQQNDQRRQTLVAQLPPPLTPTQRDKIGRLNAAARESGREGMPSRELHRRGGTGAADAIRQWEKGKKQHVLWWKATQILLNPESDARDLCNFERFRPSRPGDAEHPDNALTPVFTQSPQSREHWDATFDKDWKAKETQEAFIARMAAQGIKVTFKRARKLREPKDGGKVYECKHAACEGRIFSGPLGKASYTRHTKKHHGGIAA